MPQTDGTVAGALTNQNIVWFYMATGAHHEQGLLRLGSEMIR